MTEVVCQKPFPSNRLLKIHFPHIDLIKTGEITHRESYGYVILDEKSRPAKSFSNSLLMDYPEVVELYDAATEDGRQR